MASAGAVVACATSLKTGDPDSRNPHRTITKARALVQRLLSPVQVAAYLGLRDRFAVYRLVASGRLPALRLANKLRVDLRDLDAMIENAKAGGTPRPTHPTDRRVSRPVRQRLAPRPVRHRAVTMSVTVPPGNS
jgi:excisionase family DNA binding protein